MWDFEFDRLSGSSTAGDLPQCCEAWLLEQALEERLRRNRELQPAQPGSDGGARAAAGHRIGGDAVGAPSLSPGPGASA